MVRYSFCIVHIYSYGKPIGNNMALDGKPRDLHFALRHEREIPQWLSRTSARERGGFCRLKRQLMKVSLWRRVKGKSNRVAITI